MGDNSVIYRVGLNGFCALPFLSRPSIYSINQVSCQSLVYLPRYGPDRHPFLKNKFKRGNNSVNLNG